jgi:hypothetical protein
MRQRLIQKQVRRPRQRSQEGWFRNNLQWLLQLQQLHEQPKVLFGDVRFIILMISWDTEAEITNNKPAAVALQLKSGSH